MLGQINDSVPNTPNVDGHDPDVDDGPHNQLGLPTQELDQLAGDNDETRKSMSGYSLKHLR